MIKKLELNMSNDKNDIRKLSRIFIYDEILLYVNFYHNKNYYKPGILRDKTIWLMIPNDDKQSYSFWRMVYNKPIKFSEN